MRDNRAHRRYLCNFIVHYDTMNGGGMAVIKDISRRGLRISCRPKDELKGYLKITSFVNGNSAPTSRVARIVWQADDPTTGQREVGLEMPLEQDWLEGVIQSSAAVPEWDIPEARLDLVMGY